MRRVVPLLALMLFGCGEDPEEKSVEPESYTILPADLWASPPTDYCRRENADFLNNLLDLVARDSGYPRSSIEFVSFNVAEADSAGQRHGMIRVRTPVSWDGGEAIGGMLTAAGPIDPNTCEFKMPMKFSTGPSSLRD